MTTTWEGPEPVVWIVDAEHWPRACLRAELIERGYHAVGFETVRDALTSLPLPGTPRPHVIVIDLAGQGLQRRQFERLARAGAALIGIAGGIDLAHEPGSDSPQELPWTALLRRPLSLGAIADTVDRQLAGQAASPAP
jgi:hypothetical protein